VANQFNEYDALKVVSVRRAQDAFVHQVKIDGEWRDLRYQNAPDWDEAVYEHRAFVDILRDAGAMVQSLPSHEYLTLDSIYTRDATIISPKGPIICNMSRNSRCFEPGFNVNNFSIR
jgi:N-dimethylarginine dimethylaminohydrolase